MPISVRDIQEKEFSRQKRDGYNIEEVDDFLDEISDQLSVLIRENMALAEQVKSLQAENEKLAAGAPAAAEPAPAPASAEPAPASEPAYDEPSYFKTSNWPCAIRWSTPSASPTTIPLPRPARRPRN